MRYAVVFERSRTGYGAYVPDLPGCVAVAKTLDKTKRLIREAIEFHIEGLRQHGDPVPAPTSSVASIKVGRVNGKKRKIAS